MFVLFNIALVFGAAYLGGRGGAHYKTRQTKSWLLKPVDPLRRALKSGSTRIYIVRSWPEQGWLRPTSVTRYALEEPSSGRRYGYASVEGLLEGLSAHLGKAQGMPEEAEETEFSGLPVLAF